MRKIYPVWAGPQHGFNIIELMIVLAIAAVLVAMSAPSFIKMIKDNRLATESNNFIAAINNARTEAIRRSTNVIICQSDTPLVAAPTCDSEDDTWQTGWLMFVDVSGDGAYTSGGTDILVKVGSPVGNDITIDTNDVDRIIYASEGTLDSSITNAIHFAICDERGTGFGRQIDISITGRPNLIKGTPTTPISSCTDPS